MSRELKWKSSRLVTKIGGKNSNPHMGMPHLSTGQHHGFINTVWYKVIFRLKKITSPCSKRVLLSITTQKSRYTRTRRENQEDNLDNVKFNVSCFFEPCDYGAPEGKRWNDSFLVFMQSGIETVIFFFLPLRINFKLL